MAPMRAAVVCGSRCPVVARITIAGTSMYTAKNWMTRTPMPLGSFFP